jgi:hypothetical protein
MRRYRRGSSVGAVPGTFARETGGRGSIGEDGVDADFAGAGADRTRTLTGAAARATIFHNPFGGVHSGDRVGAGAITGPTRHASLEAVSTFVRHGTLSAASIDPWFPIGVTS